MKRTHILLLAGAVISFGLASCKSNSTDVTVSKPQKQVGQSITSDTLSGSIKGTMISGHTYYFAKDIAVEAGDTVLMQSGVHLIAIAPDDPTNSSTPGPQISVYGTFISLGTKDDQNWITVQESKRTYANLNEGLWGGIQCDVTSGDLILKWTHCEYIGGPAPAGTPIAKAGDHRYGIWFQSVAHNFILEDSWIRGTADDPIRISGGRISVMRNTFEFGGKEGGDGLNIKGGTVGDCAYNLFIGDATNGPKLSGKGNAAIETNVNIYNNTIVGCGWRMVEAGRSGSTNIEEGARGTEYNNLIVNCLTGFRLLPNPAADTAHTWYANQFYYGQVDSMAYRFYPNDGVQVPKSGDVAGNAKANNPQFVNFDPNQFTESMWVWPIPLNAEPHAINEQGSSDFRLKSTSPCIGKGITTIPANAAADNVTIPMAAVPIGGDFGATQQGLGGVVGAYQSDGSGNQH